MRCPDCGSILSFSFIATRHRLVYQCGWSRHDDRFFTVENNGTFRRVKPVKIGEDSWGVNPITVT